MLLLAAANETALLAHLAEALPVAQTEGRPPLVGSSAAVRRRLLLTLLFLGAVGLHRTWDLRSYTADGLALLTGRKRAYGYRYTEAFLSQIAHFDGAERLTDALASWARQLWHLPDDASEAKSALTCYVDGHRKPVYSETLIPRGLVGRLGAILGCRTLVLLHDEQGHPLLATTHRGDQHLTVGLPSIIARYEHNEEHVQLKRIIVDREGMATEFLASLHAEGRTVVTILRTNQYHDLASFSEVGTFVALSTDPQGQILREVAPACIALPRPDHPGEVLCLQVALIRDLRRWECNKTVELEAEDLSGHPSSDQTRSAPLQEATQAIPTPGRSPKLIPIVTTAATADALELAQAYTHRWSAQENVIKDYLLPLGLDTNHGFAKAPVENSEMNRRRTQLQQRMNWLKQRVERTQERIAQAGKRRERLGAQQQKRATQLYRQLRLDQRDWQEQGIDDQEIDRRLRRRKAFNHEQMDPFRAKDVHLCLQTNQEKQKLESYRHQYQQAQQAWEALSLKEQRMYELDHRKDQVMTVCKVACANVAMWVRDQYFPASYAHATWRRLVPFFQLPGTMTCDTTTVWVQLRPFNDRTLNRDLAMLCTRVNDASPHLPDGRVLHFTLSTPCRVLPAQKQHQIT